MRLQCNHASKCDITLLNCFIFIAGNVHEASVNVLTSSATMRALKNKESAYEGTVHKYSEDDYTEPVPAMEPEAVYSCISDPIECLSDRISSSVSYSNIRGDVTLNPDSSTVPTLKTEGEYLYVTQ